MDIKRQLAEWSRGAADLGQLKENSFAFTGGSFFTYANQVAFILVVATFIGYGSTTEAFAQSLSVPTASLQANAVPNTCSVNCATLISNGLGTITQTYPAGSSFLGPYPAGYAVASASYGHPAAEVTVAAAANAIGYADLKYYFYVDGPVNTIVPITFNGIFTGEGGSSLIGTGGSEGVYVTNPITSSSVFQLSPFLVGGYGPFVATFNATAGVVYQVELQAETASNNTSPAGYDDVQLIIALSSTCSNACTGVQLNSSPPPIQITPTTLPDATSGTEYSATFTATGGSGTGDTWVLSGSPPNGFTLSPGGVLTSTGSPAAAAGPYSFTVQVTDSAGNTATQPITLEVLAIPCPAVTVTPYPGGPTSSDGHPISMNANFTPMMNGQPVGLLAAASACGFVAFNWQQTVNIDPDADQTYAVSAPNTPLTAPHPDPPPGGYTYQAPTPNDSYPVYYNLLTGGPYSLAAHENANTLSFSDQPCDVFLPPGADREFTTSLVGLVSFSPGLSGVPLYTWKWKSTFNGRCSNSSSGTGYVSITSANDPFPADPNSGAGGATITNINGVPLPPVVSPSQLATTASGLAYSRVSQTFNGTVTLKNITSSAISGPLQILFTAMPANVTLVNATGNLSGTPYLTVPVVTSLAPGQSATVSVQFKNPSNVTIGFTPVIYSGSIN